MKLDNLAIGKSAVIVSVGGTGALRQHFLDMGLIQGVEVTMVKYAPTPATKPSTNGKATGTYEVTASDLSVRTGPGTNFRRKTHNELTADGKKHDKDKDGCLERGTRVTVYEWKNGWARTPSGWLSGDYLRKV